MSPVPIPVPEPAEPEIVLAPRSEARMLRIEALIKRLASGDFSATDRGDGSTDHYDRTMAQLHQLGDRLREHQDDLENLVAKRTQELQVVQAALQLLVLTDELTGLATKAVVEQKLREAYSAAESTGRYPTLLSLDLDRFKLINDTMGHHAGDEVLCKVAKKLRDVAPSDCTVARMSGDEFAIVIPHSTQTDVLFLVQQITKVMNEGIDLLGINIKVLGSLGVRFGEAGLSTEVQLRDADFAMYQSKKDGEGAPRFFLPAMAEATYTRRALSKSLRTAMAKGELELRYQPLVNLGNGGIAAVEALVRWRHPEFGLVGPDVFLPLARANGLMADLGRWVLRKSLETVARWRAEGRVSATFHLSVNMSPMELSFRDLQPTIVALLKECKIPPENFLVEITEFQDVTHNNAALYTLDLLREAGIGIAIDDFGTGYSSISYLMSLHATAAKIDKSIVAQLAEPGGEEFVDAIVRLIHSAGLISIAEGIETEEQAEVLRRLGCGYAQGRYFGWPVSAATMENDVLLRLPCSQLS